MVRLGTFYSVYAYNRRHKLSIVTAAPIAVQSAPHLHSCSISSVAILQNLTEARNSLEELWEKRKVKLELGLEHRVFEVEVDKVS